MGWDFGAANRTAEKAQKQVEKRRAKKKYSLYLIVIKKYVAKVFGL